MKKTAVISSIKEILLTILIIAISDKSTAFELFQTPNPSTEKAVCAGKEYLDNFQIDRHGDLRLTHGKPLSPEILDIRIKGTADIDSTLVLALFGLKNGTVFSEEEAEIGIERIKKLSAVKNVFLRKEYNIKKNGVYLTLILQKARTFIIYPFASRTLSDKLSMGFKISDSNFRRRNEKLDFCLLIRGATILRAEWEKPCLPRIPLLGLQCYVKYQDYTYPYPEFEGNFLNDRIHRLESSVSLCFQIKDYFSISISPGIDEIFGEGPVLKKNYGESIFTEPHEGLFSTLEISMHARKLNNSFYPTSGFNLKLSHKNWGLFEKTSSMKTGQYYFRGSFIFRMKRPIFHIHTRSVISNSGSPLILQEHLGGEASIRGYEFGVLRGENSFLSRYEIRLPLNFTNNSDMNNTLIPLDFSIFLDTGMCWNKDDSLSRDLMHSGFGCCMNIISPERAILRIGFMWNRKSTGNFYFDVGMDF